MAIDAILPRTRKRQARRARRKEKYNNKKEENTYLGGSKAEEKALYSDAKRQSSESSSRSDKAYDRVKDEYGTTSNDQMRAEKDYQYDRGQAGGAMRDYDEGVGQINSAASKSMNTLGAGLSSSMATRNNALATNSLVNSTESVLAGRQAALAGSPTIGQATDTAILANQANAQAQQQYSAGLVNKGAMGLAAGQGEGGALALQAAMAGASSGVADMAAQRNLQAQQLNAGMRFDAATAQRAEDVASANLGVDARLAAAEAERANQLAVAEANAAGQYGTAASNAELGYNAQLATQDARGQAVAQRQGQQSLTSGRDLTLAGQRANLATGGAQIAAAGEATDKDYQANILTAKYNAGQARNKEQGRSLIKKALMPFGILGN